MFNFKKLKIVTHSGAFHADESFAIATISLLTGRKTKIIRTREEKYFSQADFVLDVGGRYDPTKKMFDHHQSGFAETHLDGTPCSSFGLVWREYGEKICGSKEVADLVDEKLVKYIDALDNGVSFCEVKGNNSIYDIPRMIEDISPTWLERENKDFDTDKAFLKAVEIAQFVLGRCIKRTQDFLKGKVAVIQAYKKTEDKRMVVLDREYPYKNVFLDYPEPLFVVLPRLADNTWCVSTIRKGLNTFANRLDLPVEWAGKTGDDLAKVTGVADAIFCHRGRFLIVAKTKESAIKLAYLALNNK
ncbi:MAG: MYG1 family protein [Minisyncoccia bacterium]